MSTYLINSNTSVVAIKTNRLSTGEHALVYLPPTDNIGQLITIRDTFGYLSTPQQIIVSTTGGANITGGLTSLKIQQGYGYLTLRSESRTTWSIVDQNAFSSPTSIYNIRGITYGALNVIKTGFIRESVSSTGSYKGINSIVFSSLVSFGGFFVNSAVVNDFNRRSDTYYQSGSLLVTGSTTMLSSIILPGGVNIDGANTTLGSLRAASSMTMSGPLVFSTGSGKLSVRDIISTNYRLYLDNNISTGGALYASSIARIQNSLYVSTLQTSAEYGNILQTNEVMFSGNVYIRNRPDITVVSPNYTDVTSPVIEMQQGVIHSTKTSAFTYLSVVKTNHTNTSILNVGSSVNASGVGNLYLNLASIQNSGGSLVVSSIVTSNLNVSNIYGGNGSVIPAITTGNINTSSLSFQGGVTYLQSTSVSLVVADTCSTNTTITSTLIYGNSALNVAGLSLSSIFVSTAFLANQMSSFSIPYSIFNNSQGRFYTSNTVTSTTMTSSLYGVSYIAGNNSLAIGSSSVSVPYAAMNSANVALPTTTSSFTTTSITLGAPYSYSTLSSNAPYVTASTISGLTSNTDYESISGLGIPYNPLRIKAAVDRTVNLYFQNTSSFSVRYLTMQYTYQNSGSATGSAGIRMVNNGIISTILTFSASPIQTIQTAYLSNFPVDANPIVSTYLYYLTGPKTYLPPSTTVSNNIVLAGGISQTTTMTYSSDGGNSWAPLKFTALTSSCLGIAWGSNKWLAVGEGPSTTLAYSYSGTVWYSLSRNIFTIRGKSVAWNGQIWVGTGEGTNTLGYSRDGINWTGAGSTIFTAGNSVAWNGSQWLAVGQGSNTLAYSPDGINWTGLGSTVFTTGNSVAWNGSQWLAAGQGSNTLAYSSDGSSWTGLGSTILRTGTTVAWNGFQWLAGGGAQIATSANGSTWTNQNVSTVLSSVRGIAYSASNWVATGVPITDSLAYSLDGSNWRGRTGSSIFTQGSAVANRYSSPVTNTFISILAAGTEIKRTTDGTTWTTAPFTSTVYCMAWNGQIWVAGGTGTYQIAYSTNGTSWTGVTLPNMTTVFSVAWGLGTWLAVGTGANGRTSASSPDGINWTEINYVTGGFFPSQANGITWSENLWVAVGSGLGFGIIFSQDGVTWVAQLTNIFTTGRCVVNNGEIWLAGGEGPSTMAYSYDGAIWSGIPSSVFSASVLDIKWGNNLWVAMGSGGNSIAFSYDGIRWIGLGTDIFTTGLSVTWNGSQWFATGSGPNTLASSLDGVNWIPQGSSVGGFSIVAQTILPNTAINVNEPAQVRWDLSGAIQISPSAIEKPINSLTAWNSRASSLDGYTSNASLTFIVREPNSAFMMGFSEAPRTTNSYTAINYAFYVTTLNTLFLYELGTEVLSLGAFKTSDILSLKFTGTQIIYYVNSVAVRTVARPIGNPLYLSSSFRSPGSRVDEIEFQPLYQMTAVQPIPDAYSYLTSIRPVRDDLQSVTYSMPANSAGIGRGDWQFNIPISGNLSTQSSVLYADFLLNSTKLFSTSYVVSGFYQQPSTYNLTFNVSTAVSTLTTDTININLRTSRGTGETYFYNSYSTTNTILSTVVRNNLYNLSSISYLQFYHTSFNSGLQTSEFSISLNSLSTNTQKLVDSNYSVSMNKGYMVWPNRLYGISINNRYNDLQTRNLTYSGSLYNASDPKLKSGIEYAPIDELYEKVDRLSLRYYGFSDSYLSTFKPADRHQIGLITSEVQPIFPEFVNSVEPAHLDMDSLNVIDRGQLKFAHLGATQKLIEKISTLSGETKDLR